MYKYKKGHKTSLHVKDVTVEGETIETKVKRITTNKEPITDGAPEIFTERKDGVQAGYNIRTDRFELAVEATDYITRSELSKRDNIAGKVIDINEGSRGSEDTVGESTAGE